MGLLHKAGLRLGKYHIEKRMAIEEESYDRAKLKKDHAEEYREAVIESLRIDQLLESDGVRHSRHWLSRERVGRLKASR